MSNEALSPPQLDCFSQIRNLRLDFFLKEGATPDQSIVSSPLHQRFIQLAGRLQHVANPTGLAHEKDEIGEGFLAGTYFGLKAYYLSSARTRKVQERLVMFTPHNDPFPGKRTFEQLEHEHASLTSMRTVFAYMTKQVDHLHPEAETIRERLACAVSGRRSSMAAEFAGHGFSHAVYVMDQATPTISDIEITIATAAEQIKNATIPPDSWLNQ